MSRAPALFPTLTDPEWLTPHKNQWEFNERGWRLTAACKKAIGIGRQGMMPVDYFIKRSAIVTYTPEACTFFNRKNDAWEGEKLKLDFEDYIGTRGLVLQSPDRRKRLACVYGLADSELVNFEFAPDLNLICKGSVNVQNWQCANREGGSYGAELHPMLLHVLRTGKWPVFDERLDAGLTVQQQLDRLLFAYRSATLEAELSVKERLDDWHTEHWQGLAKTYSEKYVLAGGLL